MGRCQFIQQAVYFHCQVQVDGSRPQQGAQSVNWNVLPAIPTAALVDQTPPHGSSSYSEKVGSVPPIPVFRSHERRVNLIDKLRRLPRVGTALFAQKSARKPSQVGQYQIEQFLFDRAISSRPRAEQPGNVSVAVLFQHGPL
jgi:hypothetical protein